LYLEKLEEGSWVQEVFRLKLLPTVLNNGSFRHKWENRLEEGCRMREVSFNNIIIKDAFSVNSNSVLNPEH
jgi:hypothetical protein